MYCVNSNNNNNSNKIFILVAIDYAVPPWQLSSVECVYSLNSICRNRSPCTLWLTTLGCLEEAVDYTWGPLIVPLNHVCWLYSISHRMYTRFALVCYDSYIRYWWTQCIDPPVFFRVASLALGQSYDCPNVREITLKDTVKKTGHKPKQNTSKSKTYFVGCTLSYTADQSWPSEHVYPPINEMIGYKADSGEMLFKCTYTSSSWVDVHIHPPMIIILLHGSTYTVIQLFASEHIYLTMAGIYANSLRFCEIVHHANIM